MEAYYLITYFDIAFRGYHYDITSNVESWLDDTAYVDDEIAYVLINALPVSQEFAKRWQKLV